MLNCLLFCNNLDVFTLGLPSLANLPALSCSAFAALWLLTALYFLRMLKTRGVFDDDSALGYLYSCITRPDFPQVTTSSYICIPPGAPVLDKIIKSVC